MTVQPEIWIWRGIAAVSALGLAKKYFYNSKSDPISKKCIVRTQFYGDICYGNDEIIKSIYYLASNPKVQGVLFEIDSPGGNITPSEALYKAFQELSVNKPLVVSVKANATSGGYMAILPADKIFAYETSSIGSIGVLSEWIDSSEALTKDGKKHHIYRTSPIKGGPSEFETPSQEIIKAIQMRINSQFEVFKDFVIENRPLVNIDLVATGEEFNGRSALKLGLIDAIGTERDALRDLQTNYGLEHDLPVIDYDL